MRLVIIMTNNRFTAKLELTISRDRLQDSLWRAVGKGVNCTSCESKECPYLSYVSDRGWGKERDRVIETEREESYSNNVFVSRSSILREPDNYIPRIALSCAQPAAVFCPATHRHDLLLENFNTLYKVADSRYRDQRDRGRISRFARITPLSGNLPFARLWFHKRNFVLGLLSTATLLLIQSPLSPSLFQGEGKLAKRDGITRPPRPSLGIVSSSMWRLISFEN